MRQAEVILLNKQETFNYKELPIIRAFRDYFQDKTFQYIRESKALAYSVYATYRVPAYANQSFYTYAYIGTQADKLQEALNSMHHLYDSLPLVEKDFTAAKQAIMQQIRSERIKPSMYFSNYYSALKLGLNADVRKEIMEVLPTINVGDLVKFHEQHYSKKPCVTLLIGKKELLPTSLLEPYGKVKWLQMEEVFGY